MQFSAYLKQQQQADLYRSRKAYDSPQGAIIRTGKNSLLNFCSNDYLGLANDPRIISAYKKGVELYGVGSGASQLVCGYNRSHRQLEERLSDFLGRERALLFNSGYMANLGVLQALLSRSSFVYLDRLVHASIIDAARLSGAKLKRYPHLDYSSLKKMLVEKQRDFTLVASDSVFSMDGDIADLDKLNEICRKHNSFYLIDDAHGFGVLGKRGKGIYETPGFDAIKPDIYLASLGKALGTFGAFVAGDEEIIETLIQKSRSLIYTTALPPALAYASLESLNIVENETFRREKLSSLINMFKLGAKQLGLNIKESKTAIQPLLLGDAQRALALSEYLRKENILVSAIRPPTVPKDSSRLRITLSAAHTEQQINILLDALDTGLKKVFNEN